MITLSFDTAARTVKLSASTTIKAGGNVTVRLEFTNAPGNLTAASFALGRDNVVPRILAFVDEFAKENDTLYIAQLDATDTRLAKELEGVGRITARGELITVIDGKREIWPSVTLTVEQAISAGPQTSEGGPGYYTETEVDALLAATVPRTVPGKYRIKTDGSLQLWNATQSKWHTLALSGAAGAEVLAIAAGDSNS